MFLLLVVLWKKFPLIGGNINAALLLTGVLTLILGAVSDPADDPVKSMFYSLPMCIVFLITGLVFLYT